MAKHIKLGFVTFLTVVRFPLVLGFFACAVVNALHPRPGLFLCALFLLIASAATDLFDGYFARHFRVKTSLGAHMDPLMDKFFYLSTLPLLVFVAMENGRVAHAVILLVLTLLFLARDQWVTFLRAMGSLDNISGAAHWSGKLRTAVNFPLICVLYWHEASPWGRFPEPAIYAFEAMAVAITLISLYIYTRRYWPCMVKAMRIEASEDALEAP